MDVLKPTNISKAVIFNCSDGPSAYGFVQPLADTSPGVNIVLMDINGLVAQTCEQFIRERLPRAINLQAVERSTEEIYRHSEICDADLFLSFEPIGDLTIAFSGLYSALKKGSQITVAARGFLSHGIQALRLTAKTFNMRDNFFVRETDTKTPEGKLLVASLTKA